MYGEGWEQLSAFIIRFNVRITLHKNVSLIGLLFDFSITLYTVKSVHITHWNIYTHNRDNSTVYSSICALEVIRTRYIILVSCHTRYIVTYCASVVGNCCVRIRTEFDSNLEVEKRGNAIARVPSTSIFLQSLSVTESASLILVGYLRFQHEV